MEKEKKCALCGKTFVSEYSNKKYCSFVCKDAAIRTKRLEWKAKNPDYYKYYSRERRKKTGLEKI